MSFKYVTRAFSHDLSAHLRDYAVGSHTSRLAFKAALACVLSVLGALYLELDNVHWAAISALVVTQPVAGATVNKALLRSLGTAAGAMIGVLLSDIAATSQPALFLVLFFGTVLSVWASANFPKVSYAIFLGGITSLIVVLGSLHEPGQAFYIAYYRAFEICVGIAASTFVCVVLLPDLAGPLLKRNMAGCLGLARTLVRMAVNDYLGGAYRSERFNGLKAALDRHLDTFAKLAAGSKVEGTVNRERLALAQDLVGKLAVASDILSAFHRQAGHGREPAWSMIDRDSVDEIYAAFREFCRQAAGYIYDRPEPGGIARAVERFHKAVDALAAIYGKSRGRKAHLDAPVADIVRFHQFVRCFKGLASVLALEPGTLPGRGNRRRTTPLSPAYQPLLKQMLVSGLAMAIVPFFWIKLDIPGMAEMAVSVAIILQPGDVETERKAFLRLAGCLAGGVLGLFFLGFEALQYFGVFLAVFFVSVYGFSYINFGPPSIAYFGLQGNFALIMAFIQGRGPADSLAPPVERLVAIFLAALVIVVLSSLVMPDPPMRQLRRALDGCRRSMARLLRLTAGSAPLPRQDMHKEADLLREATAFAWRRLATVERIGDGADKQALESARRFLYACDLMRVNAVALLDADRDQDLAASFREWDMHPERVLAQLPALFDSPDPMPGLKAAHHGLHLDLDRRREEAAKGRRAPLETALAVSAFYLAASGVVDSLQLAAETEARQAGENDAEPSARSHGLAQGSH